MIGQVEPYVIGKMYRVPMAFMSRNGEPKRWWPVLGPFHQDAEDIGFPEWHFHVDYRFASDVHLKILGVTWVRGHQIPSVYRTVLTAELAEKPETSVRWRKCRRAYPKAYPVPEVRWMKALEKRYAQSRLSDDMRCPHRGASLVGLPQDERGCVACPLHGLKWNCETKRLVVHTKGVPDEQPQS